MYDLYVMMSEGIADRAIEDDELWEAIRHHRESFTSIKDIDYTPDVRSRIRLVPGQDIISIWEEDYRAMEEAMIYDPRTPSFEELIEGMAKLEDQFRKH